MVSIGNHEFTHLGLPGTNDPSGAGAQWAPPFSNAYDDGGGECGVPTSRRFRTPLNGNGVFWYSFAVGSVHVAMISSEHDPSPGSPMGAWLESDLMSVDRSVTPWLIVAMHRPLVHNQKEGAELRMSRGLNELLEPLLLRAEVDVVLAGHIHSYQRSCRMAAYACVAPGERGLTHHTNGAAGMAFSLEAPNPAASFARSTIIGLHGYSVLHAANASALHMSFVANRNGSALDEFWLLK